MSFESMWAELLPVGRRPTGGYERFAWTSADLACRDWFRAEADRRSMAVETDRNGNLWAWLGDPGPDAFVTGSHLDSVPGGGAYDGPLGIVAAYAAIDALPALPTKPIAVVAFSDEEGARFGVACLGSRLLAGAADPARTLALTDSDGTRLDEAMRAQGHDPSHAGADPEALARIGMFVELHVEQGRALTEPIGLAAGIWPHGRWRYHFTGEGNHAGTTALADRRDPMLSYAMTVLAARKQALLAGALATFGRVQVDPGGTNAIAASVTGWLDGRAPDQSTLDTAVAAIAHQARDRAGRDGVTLQITAESVTPVVDFPAGPREWAAAVLTAEAEAAAIDRSGAAVTDRSGTAAAPDRSGAAVTGRSGAAAATPPVLATGAGHDAGVLAAAGVPTVMLFVRNPTGISHAPAEHAEPADCLHGVAALTALMAAHAC